VSGVEIWYRNTAPGANDGILGDETIFTVLAAHNSRKKIYLVNQVSMVELVGSGNAFTFRNPPHFMSFINTQAQDSRDAEYETEAVIDHAFYHDSTAPFISYRLIQRMVASNPSPRYIEVVARAFQTGSYDGVTYSGEYGDLLATAHAILGDREARSALLEADPLHGRLREPLLKVLHTMRAMEYRSFDAAEVELRYLQTDIGQEAFNSPGVFNFYLPEYSPIGPIRDAGLVAPEGQLGTGPFILGFANGMRSLIARGLSSSDGGFGAGGDADGSLMFTGSSPSDAAKTVGELDLLLTGGRLSPEMRSVIVTAYEKKRAEVDVAVAMRDAQTLLLLSAQFHSTNLFALDKVARTVNDGTPSQGRPYKNIVIVYMNGGCDSYNLLVPHSGCTSGKVDYQQYLDVRTNVALTKDELLQINVDKNLPFVNAQPCSKMGLHPGLKNVQRLYNEGGATWFANTGVLVEPLTKEEYKAKPRVKRIPLFPFSHNHQTKQTHSVHAGKTHGTKGVLGRMVEVLVGHPDHRSTDTSFTPYRSASYSLAGLPTILDGQEAPSILTGSGITRYHGYNSYKDEIAAMTRNTSASIFAETYNAALATSLRESEYLGAILADPSTTPVTTFPTTGLGKQFKQVTKVVKARQTLNEERQVFYTNIGGFDTHSSLKETVQAKMEEIDGAIGAFEAEMKAEGIWDDTVVLTMSEFGRTLHSNGLGVDHAWAGNYFMVGGGLQPQRIHGQFPDDLSDGGDVVVGTGRGQVLPTTSWDSVWHSLAQWMGLPEDQLKYVIPNIDNWDRDKHLMTKEQVFE
jgi:uncharacterized protein (DUF1501 family)